jgi:hypothetical protein
MNFKRLICRGITAFLIVVAGSTSHVSQAAPLQGELVPANVTSTGKFKVVISNSETDNGKAKLLELRVEVGPAGVSKVVYEVSKDDKFAFSVTEFQYPYCIFGNEENKCAYQLAGDEIKDKAFVLKPGNYAVKVKVFGTATTPDWSGTVKFKLVVGDLTSVDLPYGTGSGNNPIVKIVDPYWRKEGMKKIQIEARLQNGSKDKQVQYVEFRVVRTSDYETVYVGTETGAPYCIFGEPDGKKTCKILNVGDTWPQSYEKKSKQSGDGYEKEKLTDIPQSKITAGEYNLSIFVSTNFGTWSSQGDFTLLE